MEAELGACEVASHPTGYWAVLVWFANDWCKVLIQNTPLFLSDGISGIDLGWANLVCASLHFFLQIPMLAVEGNADQLQASAASTGSRLLHKVEVTFGHPKLALLMSCGWRRAADSATAFAKQGLHVPNTCAAIGAMPTLSHNQPFLRWQ